MSALTEDRPRFRLLGICHLCARRRDVDTCDAFPGGIPNEILVGDFDHRRPYPGDRGLLFSPKPGAEVPARTN
jgi:hypothetical protein